MKNSRIKPGDLCSVGDSLGFKVRLDPDGPATGGKVMPGNVLICIATSFVIFDDQKIPDALVMTGTGVFGWIIQDLLRCESH